MQAHKVVVSTDCFSKAVADTRSTCSGPSAEPWRLVFSLLFHLAILVTSVCIEVCPLHGVMTFAAFVLWTSMCAHVADGKNLANLGGKRLNVITNDVQAYNMTYQVDDVTHPVKSVSIVCDIRLLMVFFDMEVDWTMSAWSRAPVTPRQGQRQ